MQGFNGNANARSCAIRNKTKTHFVRLVTTYYPGEMTEYYEAARRS